MPNKVVTHQPAISFSISLQHLLNRAGGRTSNVAIKNRMHYIAVIFFIGIGMAAIAFAVGHEIYWWQRRTWRSSTGVVIDFKEEHWADGGPTYSAVIEFELNGVIRSFDSQYGSGKKPKLGDNVPIVVSSAEEGAAEISQPHRILIPIGFCAFGAICIIVGANIKPIGEQDGGGKPATRSESK